MNLEVEGRRFLIVGGSRGLGRAVAETLAHEGALTVVTSRGFKEAQDAARCLPKCQGMALDTGDQESIGNFIKAWGHAPLDGIFVNTGGPRPGEFFDLTPEDWMRAFSQLVYGPAQLVKDLAPNLVDGGSLLFNTSSSIRVPIAHLFLSNVLRPAVEALAKGLSFELAARRIRTNVIAPGRIATDRVEELDQAAASRNRQSIEFIRQQAQAAIPLGRYGLPEEFGRTAAFLLSPAASYISGISLFVDGGQTKAL